MRSRIGWAVPPSSVCIARHGERTRAGVGTRPRRSPLGVRATGDGSYTLMLADHRSSGASAVATRLSRRSRQRPVTRFSRRSSPAWGTWSCRAARGAARRRTDPGAGTKRRVSSGMPREAVRSGVVDVVGFRSPTSRSGDGGRRLNSPQLTSLPSHPHCRGQRHAGSSPQGTARGARLRYRGGRSGERALELVRSERLDLCSPMSCMPGIGGYEVSNRSDRHGMPGLPVLLTSLNDRWRSCGARLRRRPKYVTKPYQPDGLLTVCARCCSRVREDPPLPKQPFTVELLGSQSPSPRRRNRSSTCWCRVMVPRALE